MSIHRTALSSQVIKPVSYTHLDVYKRQIQTRFRVDLQHTGTGVCKGVRCYFSMIHKAGGIYHLLDVYKRQAIKRLIDDIDLIRNLRIGKIKGV